MARYSYIMMFMKFYFESGKDVKLPHLRLFRQMGNWMWIKSRTSVTYRIVSITNEIFSSKLKNNFNHSTKYNLWNKVCTQQRTFVLYQQQMKKKMIRY